ncbi:integrase core domain-containing protein [Snodgrassella gandavensis]|uniref:integrase core domain-containing protein n=1 Tax=Snodgrassella gandavensis TaxID=2946698 RepID=UPI0034DF7C7A
MFFNNLKQIRSAIEEWLMVYNTGRLHEALNNMTLNISHTETRSVIFCVNYVLRMA